MKVLIKVMFARHSSDNSLQVHFIRAETVPNAMSIIFPLSPSYDGLCPADRSIGIISNLFKILT